MPSQKKMKTCVFKLLMTTKFRRGGTRHPIIVKAKLKTKRRRSNRPENSKRKRKADAAVKKQQAKERNEDGVASKYEVRQDSGSDSPTPRIEATVSGPPFHIKTFTTAESEYPKFTNFMSDRSGSDWESESDKEPLYRSFNPLSNDCSPTEIVVVDQKTFCDESSTDMHKSQYISSFLNGSTMFLTNMTSEGDTMANSISTKDDSKAFRHSSPTPLQASTPKVSATEALAEPMEHPESEMESDINQEEIINISTGSEWEDITTSDDQQKDPILCDADGILLEDKFHVFAQNSDSFTVVLEHPIMLAVVGRIEVRVLYGCLDVNGYRLKPQDGFAPIYSPQTNSHIVIATCSPSPCSTDPQFERNKLAQDLFSAGYSEGDTRVILGEFNGSVVILKCKKLSNPVCSYVARYFPKIFKVNRSLCGITKVDLVRSYNCAFRNVHTTRCISADPYWKQIAADISVDAQYKATPPRIIVCGGKGVGKSTLCRYLLNSLLNVCAKVCYIDGDPGQSEFTPPGLLSLLEVTEPCLGPGFTHHQIPKMSFFMGGVSAAESPDHYVKCIHELWKFYMQHNLKHHPLLINTMGWNRGMGLALLVDMINILQPTHLIQIDSTVYRGRNCPNLSAEHVKSMSGWTLGFPEVKAAYMHYIVTNEIENEKSEYTPVRIRQINLLAYLSKLQEQPDICDFKPLNHLKFHKIKWSDVALYVCHARVANSDILYVFNASIVALCRCDPKEIISSTDPTLPKFLKKMPVCECFGYGIIRGICMEEKSFYVLTSLHPEELRKVNALLRGAINIPLEIFLEQDVDVPIPYLARRKTLPSLYLQIGQKTVKPRTYRIHRSAFTATVQ